MNHVVKCCAIPCKMIIEERYNNNQMSTKNMVGIDPNAAVTPIRVLLSIEDNYEASDIYQDTGDKL